MTQTMGKILAIAGIATLAGCANNKHHGTTVAYDSGYTTTSHGYVATSYDDTSITPAYDRSSMVVNDTTFYTPPAPSPAHTITPSPTVTTTAPLPGATFQNNTAKTAPRATAYNAPRDTVYANPNGPAQKHTQTSFRPVAMKPARHDLTLDEFRKHVQNQSAVIVDARLPKDFKKGHVRGAVNIPAGDEDAYLAKFQKDVAPDQLVIIYCGGPDCPAGDNVATYLSTQGFTNLRVYKPGWQQLSNTDLD
jgi:rhodanese-related sulfurtransferase